MEFKKNHIIIKIKQKNYFFAPKKINNNNSK